MDIKVEIIRLLCRVPEPFYGWLRSLGNWCVLLRHPEKVTHPGNLYPDKTFYVINNLSNQVGLAGWYDIVLGYLERAQKKRWEVVINPPAPVQSDDGDWNAFFKQPTDIRLSDALQGKNVVFASVLAMIHKRYNPKEIARRHELSKWVPFSDEAETFVALFANAKEPMVAVRFRGTDYRAGNGYCPAGHAKVPSVDLFCDRVEADLNKWGVPVESGKHVFVVTEEQEALDAIKKRFPECRYVEKERFSNFKPGQYLVHHRLPTMTPKENNFMYLLEISAMSKCDYLVGGINGGVLMALNLNGNRYKGVDMINTGVN